MQLLALGSGVSSLTPCPAQACQHPDRNTHLGRWPDLCPPPFNGWVAGIPLPPTLLVPGLVPPAIANTFWDETIFPDVATSMAEPQQKLLLLQEFFLHCYEDYVRLNIKTRHEYHFWDSECLWLGCPVIFTSRL